MKKFQFISILLTVIICLFGCDKSNEAENNGKIPVVIATSAAPYPFTSVDENGELIGYDIDTVKAIFAELPQYNISFVRTEFSSVLAGLDANRYQIGANNFAMNEVRKQKYFYTDPIFKNQYVIAVAKDNSTIHSFTDLAGKTTEVQPGLNYATALENFNKEHPNAQVKIDYTEADLLLVLKNVEMGRYDFQLLDRAMLQLFVEKHNLQLKVIELTEEDSNRIASPYSYLIVNKGPLGEQLTKDINQALKTIINNGKLTEISQHYFQADYAPK